MLTVSSLVCIYCLAVPIQFISRKVVDFNLSPAKFPIGTKIRENAIIRLSGYFFKLIAYLVGTITMFATLKQGDFIDYGMLGNVERVDFFKVYPCEITPKFLPEVYVVKFSFHLFELIETFLKRRN